MRVSRLNPATPMTPMTPFFTNAQVRPRRDDHRRRHDDRGQISIRVPNDRHIRDRSARVPGPMRPTVRPQSTPCRFRFTPSQIRTISAKRAEVHQNLSRRPSPHGTATRRWPVKCRRGHHGVQTRGARAAYHGIEDERHARLRALSRSVGTADRCAVTGRCRLLANRAVGRGCGARRPGFA
jgi:hypothetical protein